MKRRSRNVLKRKSTIIIAIVVLIMAGLGIYWLAKPNSSKTAVTSNQPGTSRAQNGKTAEAPNTVVPNPAPNPNPNVPGGSTGSNTGSRAALVAPTGTFVNNHGSNSAFPVTASSAESSTCTTTPGAACDIQFTSVSNGTVRSLGAKTASSASSSNLPAGTVTWNWTPGSVNLTSGAWKITAVATLGGQTKTTADQINLTVQ